MFFTTLLAIPEKYISIAFRMFDLDGNGEVDVDEFKKVMKAMRANTPMGEALRTNVDNNSFLPYFFGPDGKKKLTINAFKEFMKNLKAAILKVEFDRLDFERQGSISASAFATSIVGFGDIRRIKVYSPRVEELAASTIRISFEQFCAFQKVIASLDDIDEIIRLFLTSGDAFTRYDLKRAAKTVSGVDLEDAPLDVIFHLFDSNRDGKLDYDEFVGVMKGRNTMGLTKPRDTGFIRFFECSKDCLYENVGVRTAQ